MNWRVITGLILVLAIAAAQGQTKAQQHTEQQGILFATPNGMPLLADLYLPSRSGLHPAVLYLHGGGWWEGNRTQLRRLANDLADEGFVGMAVDYRLAPAVHFPVALDDVDEAILWLRTHAKPYHVDTRRIYLVGSSAGAHMALMHVLRPQRAGTEVSGVFALNPVLDLTDEDQQAEMVTRYLGRPCGESEPLCRSASPLWLVREAKVPLQTPVTLLHGTADRVVPYRQATATQTALHESGANSVLFTAEGAGHTFWAKEEWYPKVLAVAKDFLAAKRHH